MYEGSGPGQWTWNTLAVGGAWTSEASFCVPELWKNVDMISLSRQWVLTWTALAVLGVDIRSFLRARKLWKRGRDTSVTGTWTATALAVLGVDIRSFLRAQKLWKRGRDTSVTGTWTATALAVLGVDIKCWE
jgi:hypothetical protein